jgi:hypothetical protein
MINRALAYIIAVVVVLLSPISFGAPVALFVASTIVSPIDNCATSMCYYDASGGVPVALDAADLPPSGFSGPVVRKKLAQWGDPFTPPQFRIRCIGYAWGSYPWGGGWKTCNKWATDTKTMQVSAYIEVDGPTNISAAIQTAVQDCAAAAAATAVGTFFAAPTPDPATRAAAAYSTLYPTFQACLTRAGAAIASFQLLFPTSAEWSNWSGDS